MPARNTPRLFPPRALARWAAAMALAVAAGGTSLGCDPSDNGPVDTTVSSLDVPVPADFVPQKGRDSAVRLRAPKSWKPVATSGTVVLALKTDEPGASVNVVVVPAQPGETIDKTLGRLPRELEHEFADFRLERKEVLILHDLPAGRLVYEASRSGFHGKLMQVIVTRAGKHYIFTYTAPPERYDTQLPKAEQVLASLDFQ